MESHAYLLADILVPVFLVDLDGLALFSVVGGKLVVQDGVPVQADALFLGCAGELQQLVFGSPFCAY